MMDPTQEEKDRLDALVADPSRRLHFVGLAGSGMSALAQYRRFAGGRASGSDRSIDRGLDEGRERARCRSLGIEVFPQDGSGAAQADAVIASTAVEAHIPDLERARNEGVPVFHRSALLAAYQRGSSSVAVAGTSGKSTVVAMTFEALRAAGLDPGVISGGDLVVLRDQGHRGNAWYGSGPLVYEADESDGSLVAYDPEHAVILNVQRDHDEIEAHLPVFDRFRRQVRGTLVLGEDGLLDGFRGEARVTFGFGAAADVRARDLRAGRNGTRFTVDDRYFEVPLPGRHNVSNALAAIALARAAGAPDEAIAEGLRGYRGVGRRFEAVGVAGGVEVIDDFAHNPVKIEATLRAAGARCDRVFAVFQPHGYGPARFMREELSEAVRRSLRPDDVFRLLPIYDAGGTAARDIASEDIAEEIAAGGADAAATRRDELVGEVTSRARPGDTVILMGARDPSLPGFARELLQALSRRPGAG